MNCNLKSMSLYLTITEAWEDANIHENHVTSIALASVLVSCRLRACPSSTIYPVASCPEIPSIRLMYQKDEGGEDDLRSKTDVLYGTDGTGGDLGMQECSTEPAQKEDLQLKPMSTKAKHNSYESQPSQPYGSES